MGVVRRDLSGIAPALVCSTPHTWNIEKGRAKTTGGHLQRSAADVMMSRRG